MATKITKSSKKKPPKGKPREFFGVTLKSQRRQIEEMEAETPQKRRKLQGAKDGVPFSKKNQPSSESKKAGWARKKTLKDLLQLTLKGKSSDITEIRESLSQLTGIPVKKLETMTFEQAMALRQIEKAISEADTFAWDKLMTRVYGAPKQTIEAGGKDGNPLPIIGIIVT